MNLKKVALLCVVTFSLYVSAWLYPPCLLQVYSLAYRFTACFHVLFIVWRGTISTTGAYLVCKTDISAFT